MSLSMLARQNMEMSSVHQWVETESLQWFCKQNITSISINAYVLVSSPFNM